MSRCAADAVPMERPSSIPFVEWSGSRSRRCWAEDTSQISALRLFDRRSDQCYLAVSMADDRTTDILFA